MNALDGNPNNAGQLQAGYADSPATADNIDELYQEVLGRSVAPPNSPPHRRCSPRAARWMGCGPASPPPRRPPPTSPARSPPSAPDPATAAELSGFQAVLAAPYGSTIEVVSHEGQVLANTTATLGLPGGNELTFQNTPQLTRFLYAVAVQKSQASPFVTDTFNQDIAWLNRVAQPMLDVAGNLTDLAAYNAANGKTGQATLANAAARTQRSKKISQGCWRVEQARAKPGTLLRRGQWMWAGSCIHHSRVAVAPGADTSRRGDHYR